MNFVTNFPMFSIILSFICVVLTSICKKKVSRIIHLCIEGVVFILTVFVLIYTTQNGSFNYSMGHFPAPFDNEIRIGVLESVLALFSIIVIVLSSLGGHKYLKDDISDLKQKYIYVLFSLVQVALLAIIYTNDIFTGYVFLEISTLASVGLVMIKETGKATLAAIRYLIFNLLGSSLFLIGCVLLYGMTGYLSMEYILEAIKNIMMDGTSKPLVMICIGLIGSGLGIKSGMFPFYFWMSDTYSEATTSSSSIVSGLISKAYIILLMKFIYRVFGVEVMMATHMNYIFLMFGVAGMVFGSLSALQQNNLKRMVAFSSAAQIGYIYLGIGLGRVGMVAAIFQILAHGITKAMLFVSSAGLAEASMNKDDFTSLKGAGKRNITSGIAFFIGSLSMVGIPTTAGFITKYLFIECALELSTMFKVVIIVALIISTILNIAYYLRTMITIYLPIENSEGEQITFKKSLLQNIVLYVFIALNLFLGLYPYLIDLIKQGLSMF